MLVPDKSLTQAEAGLIPPIVELLAVGTEPDGIVTVFVEAAVKRPFASTVMYGTSNVAPAEGVALADGP